MWASEGACSFQHGVPLCPPEWLVAAQPKPHPIVVLAENNTALTHKLDQTRFSSKIRFVITSTYVEQVTSLQAQNYVCAHSHMCIHPPIPIHTDFYLHANSLSTPRIFIRREQIYYTKICNHDLKWERALGSFIRTSNHFSTWQPWKCQRPSAIQPKPFQHIHTSNYPSF